MPCIYSHNANEIWASDSKTELDKILIPQERAMRRVTFNDICPIVPGPLIPSDPIFIKLETLKVMDIYKFQVSKFIFKCISKIAPVNFQNWFKINHERYG